MKFFRVARSKNTLVKKTLRILNGSRLPALGRNCTHDMNLKLKFNLA
jgi:hypothetical protein